MNLTKGHLMSLPRTVARSKVFDFNQYDTTKKVLFKLTVKTEDSNSNGIEIPIAIVYRMYFIGRAYDFQAIKLIQPQGKVLITFVNAQLLISELEMLTGIVKDPVLEKYLDILLPYLRSGREFKDCSIVVSVL
jgi:hypothetical protein